MDEDEKAVGGGNSEGGFCGLSAEGGSGMSEAACAGIGVMDSRMKQNR